MGLHARHFGAFPDFFLLHEGLLILLLSLTFSLPSLSPSFSHFLSVFFLLLSLSYFLSVFVSVSHINGKKKKKTPQYPTNITIIIITIINLQ